MKGRTTIPAVARSPHADARGSVYEKTTLDNGVRIVTEKIPYVRSVSLGVWADVGSRDELPELNGISHFVEHMVFKGTRNRNVREIAQSLESLGGYLNAFTTKEQTCFYARVLDANVDEAMDVLADLMLNATFDRKEMEKEKLVVIEELKNSEDDPEDIIHDYFEKSLFPRHSLGNPIIGTEQNVMKFQRADLQQHLTMHYVPSGIVVAAAGNVNHNSLVKMARRYFEHLDRPRTAPPRQPFLNNESEPGLREHPRPIKQAHVCLGTTAFGLSHPDRYTLLVMNGLLGEGMSSRLYQTIREKHGYAYSVYSFTTLMSDTGFFGTYIGTDTRNMEKAITLVHRELQKLRHTAVSADELRRTKSQIKGTLMLGLENMSSRMMRLGTTELYLQKYVTLDSILRKVDEVTPAAIKKLADGLFDEQNFSTVIIRPS